MATAGAITCSTTAARILLPFATGLTKCTFYKTLTADEYAPNADALWEVLARLDGPPTAWWPAGENSLERPALRAFPFLEELKDALAELGVDGARLSGSGGAFAAPATDGEKAKAAAAELTARGYWATITATR